jgi:L-threonylcarbamoyladenylate synthase
VDCLLDGGATPVGIESTVISLAGDSPVLLRPGTIPRNNLESLIGPLSEPVVSDTAHPSPGLHKRHYSPATALVLVTPGALPVNGQGAYLWITRSADVELPVQMPADASEYAACLYGILHDLDRQGLDWIAVEDPPAGSEWDGVRDRLARAAR